jgi:hypothetical protein
MSRDLFRLGPGFGLGLGLGGDVATAIREAFCRVDPLARAEQGLREYLSAHATQGPDVAEDEGDA